MYILISDNDSSGGSGKSFFIDFLTRKYTNFKREVIIDGREPKKTDDKHLYEQVDRETDLLCVDDLDKYFDFNNLYSKITNAMTINPKNKDRFTLSYKDSPKITVTSNYAPRNYNSSTDRRLLFTVFSDYYHKKTNKNDYNEDRGPKDDFGHNIGDEFYKSEWWNEDINFLIDCLQFYLQNKNHIIKPPLDKVLKRVDYGEMGEQFREWAEMFFAEDGENVNTEISRQSCFSDFENTTKLKWSSKKFGEALRAFCAANDYIECLNPKEMCNDTKKTRIIKMVDDVWSETKNEFVKKSKEFYYIKTKN